MNYNENEMSTVVKAMTDGNYLNAYDKNLLIRDYESNIIYMDTNFTFTLEPLVRQFPRYKLIGHGALGLN